MSSDATTTTETPAPVLIPEPTVTWSPPQLPPSLAARRRPGPIRRALRALGRGAGRMGWRLNLLLLVACFGTMVLAGGSLYALCTILILGSHEMGHYLYCRRYGVDATLPYFLPAPPPFLFGTFGAVIRMHPPIPGRRALFDIGIAGPIAGFLAALPVLVYGVATSVVVPMPTDTTAFLEFGDPLLITLFTRAIHGSLPEGSTLLMSPALMAGWFGLLVTAMNLFPVGQLDGGHVSFALSSRTHRAIARIVATAMLFLVIGGLALQIVNAWSLWSIVLLFLSRFRHPPVEAADEPLGPARIALAVSAAVIFAVSFMPVPLHTAF